jgi:hypothetical protein
MLRLDYLHRERNPLPPRLRGQLRWAAAHANRCAYSEAYALADLRRSGLDEAGISALTGRQQNLAAPEQAALAFADKLTRAADKVSDAEVSRLVAFYGEKQVVAIVLLLAYANFQDRLLLALDLPLEEDGPLPAPEVHLADRVPWAAGEAPRASAVEERPHVPAPKRIPDPQAEALGFDQLQKRLEEQRARHSRIPLPAGQPGAVRWGQLCRAYQPELAAAWSACSHAFDAEADQDPVFDQSQFWVITRSLNCFY